MPSDKLLPRGELKSLTEGLQRLNDLSLIGISQAQDVVGVSAFASKLMALRAYASASLGLPSLRLTMARLYKG